MNLDYYLEVEKATRLRSYDKAHRSKKIWVPEDYLFGNSTEVFWVAYFNFEYCPFLVDGAYLLSYHD